MVRLFKHYISRAALLLALLDFLALLGAAELAWIMRADMIGMMVTPLGDRWQPTLAFAVVLQLAMIGVGVYAPEAMQSRQYALMRLLAAVSLGVILLAIVYLLLPDVALWRSNLAFAMPLAVVMPFALRLLFSAMLGGSTFQRGILVMGAGKRAARIGALARDPSSSFNVVGYISMTAATPAVEGAIARSTIENLAGLAQSLGAIEVVLALEERRGALPLADLLRLKTGGVHVNEISSFIERETGRVDLATVNPSWFIFSDGFTAGQRLSKFAKRLFDIFASLAVLILTGPVVLIAAVAVKMDSRGPAFYRQRRVGLYGEHYQIYKVRSMRQDAEAGGKAVWAAEADPRITRIGRFLRATRIDEIPQTWNVLKGEMSFVGPRPERPEFVEELNQQIRFYEERHMVKPGLTGWAQINYPYGASIEDARAKLEYDLYYAKNYTPFLDILIMLRTLRVVIWPEGVR